RAIGAEQADDFAARDGERNISHRGPPGITLRQVGDFDHGPSAKTTASLTGKSALRPATIRRTGAGGPFQEAGKRVTTFKFFHAELDFAAETEQKQFQVFWAGDNFYAGWRARTCAANFLRDENFPTERLLQAVWQHQRLRRDALKTIDGRPVRIFHPGFASLEGGPDFRNAVMQIGDEPPRSGDVEVDLQAAGWRAHGHDRNVHFKKVMLHVVWDHASPGPSGSRADRLKPELQLPVLALKNFLDAPLAELSLSLERESLRTLPESMRGKCCAPLREMEPAKLDGLLAAAARVRFENKAS